MSVNVSILGAPGDSTGRFVSGLGDAGEAAMMGSTILFAIQEEKEIMASMHLYTEYAFEEEDPLLKLVHIFSDVIILVTSIPGLHSSDWVKTTNSVLRSRDALAQKACNVIVFGSIDSSADDIDGLDCIKRQCAEDNLPFFWGDPVKNRELANLCLRSAVHEAFWANERTLQIQERSAKKKTRLKRCSIM
jgi:hypothetical protein